MPTYNVTVTQQPRSVTLEVEARDETAAIDTARQVHMAKRQRGGSIFAEAGVDEIITYQAESAEQTVA
jgi:1,2-phenylacetyl-CoA epoxidase PaaB subunit